MGYLSNCFLWLIIVVHYSCYIINCLISYINFNNSVKVVVILALEYWQLAFLVGLFDQLEILVVFVGF